MQQQTTSEILMIRPAQFGYNPETADNNAFQQKDASAEPQQISQSALKEFDRIVQVLRDHGVGVTVIEDSETPVKPDAIFPNNWVSFHENGQVITYPVFSPLRRAERQASVIDLVANRFWITDHLALEASEAEGQFLEGTGSMILDREHKMVYACRSQRTHPDLLQKFAETLGYEPILFDAVDKEGQAIYHTNVMMALGTKLAIVCLEAIVKESERALVEQKLKASGKLLLPISLDQVYAFAGNMLEVKNNAGESLMVMSTQAFNALSESQKNTIKEYVQIVHADISTIEKYGGGSARCMMAEVFLPPKVNS